VKFWLVPPLIAVLALVMLAVAGPAYQLGILPLSYGFALMRWAAYTGIAAALVNVATCALAYRRGQRGMMALAIASAIIAVVAFVIPLRWQAVAKAAPPIHDISTDLENPPAFKAIVPLRENAPNKLDRPATVSDQQRRGYPDIQPITLPVSREEVFEEAIERIQDHDWQIIDADKESGRIEATDTTPWFGFKDDIVVRLTPWGSGTRVDMRSVSRIGVSDVGTNAKRVREFMNELKTGK
jgi:uncharacterized protein (DUF1499 family)